ncbi:MAG: enoyl-CoA hydratase/isomerase family protein [Chloroflexi bacterium]|nr:enoyl-CoA hydratase/isomerase family protein [Chloroflexota bacterium]
MTGSYEVITVERDGAVVTLTLNRPTRLNAVTMRLWDELEEAARLASDDPTVRCVVLTGAGERGFCAGRDLDETQFSDGRPFTRARLDEMQRGLIPTLVHMPKPLIAVVNGVAAGAGLALALAGDIRLASDTARFTVAFLRVGFVPDAGAAWLLPRTVGYARALELCATNDLVDAAEALRIGLVNRVVPAAQLRPAAAALAARIAAMPPLAVTATKQLLQAAPSGSLEDALELESAAQMRMETTADHQEGMAAFAERREPRFEGR